MEALGAAHRKRVCSAVALKALAVSAIPTPWLPQDPTTMALSGAYADDPQTPGAPRPAYGPSQAGREALTQVRLRLGVSGAGGLPRRVGLRDGHRRERVAPPVAMAECLALGWEGVRGSVAESQADSRRTWGRCRERGSD